MRVETKHILDELLRNVKRFVKPTCYLIEKFVVKVSFIYGRNAVEENLSRAALIYNPRDNNSYYFVQYWQDAYILRSNTRYSFVIYLL